MKALLRWCVFCVVTGRRARVDLDTRHYFDIGDRDDLSYEDKLREYRRLVDDYFQVAEYEDFCARSLPDVHEVVVDYFASPEFDTLLVEEVQRVFPAHEHEEMTARHRGLVGAWVKDQSPGGNK
jgi:hypothetical protein